MEKEISSSVGLLGRIRLTRFTLFELLLQPFQYKMRQARMKRFVDTMALKDGAKVLDLGGQPEIWDSVNEPLYIACVNLPGIARAEHETHHTIDYIEGDGCDLAQYADKEFDIVFSNSVIEHVGSVERQRAFASEVSRLAERYWVQTPSIAFPIEAHCGMPLWWFYPKTLRSFLIERWRRDLPRWTEMVESTTVISKSELRQLFPDSKLMTERLIFPKSIVAYRADCEVESQAA